MISILISVVLLILSLQLYYVLGCRFFKFCYVNFAVLVILLNTGYLMVPVRDKLS